MLRLAVTKKLRFSPVASQHGPDANRVAKLCLVGTPAGKATGILKYPALLLSMFQGVGGKVHPFIRLINKAPFPGNWIHTLEGKIWHQICEPSPNPSPTSFGRKLRNKAWPSNKTMNSQRMETTSLDGQGLSSDFLRLFNPAANLECALNSSWLWNRRPSLTQVLCTWYEVYKYLYQSRRCHTSDRVGSPKLKYKEICCSPPPALSSASCWNQCWR